MDEIIEKVGNFGPFQAVLFTSTYSTIWMAASGMMFMMYGSYNPGWHCKNSTEDNLANFTGSNKSSSSYYVSSGSNDVCQSWRECDNVDFDKESSTIVTEWNLVCDNAWIIPFMITMLMSGILVGAWICGPLGDRFGRKVSLYSSVAFHSLANLLAAFSVSWKMFAAFEFVIGIGVGGIVTAGFFYPMEFVGNWWRPVLGSAPLWGIAMLKFTLIVFIFKDWKMVLITTAVLSAIVFLPVFWIPESIRWLAVNGKHDQIQAIVQRMVSWNKKPPVDPIFIQTTTNEIAQAQAETGKPTYIDLFKTSKLRRYSIKFGIVWIIMAIAYFMISFGVKSFSGDFYLNILLFSLADIPGILFVGPIANTLGRRHAAIILLSVAALLCFGIVIVELLHLNETLTVAFVTAVKTDIVGIWSVVMLISTELYPTFVRNLHLGYLNAIARLGSIISSYMIPADGHKLFIPFAVSGFLLLFASVLIFSVSESKGRPMVETIRGLEVEKLSINSKDNCKEQLSCPGDVEMKNMNNRF